MAAKIPDWKDKVLFTPGPLTTSRTVKQAMLRDLGSRDVEFLELVRDVRLRLVGLGHAESNEYTAIPMQGSGTFGVEAVLSSGIGPDGKLLVCVNGSYGARIAQIARVLKIPLTVLEYDETVPVQAEDVDKALSADASITMVAIVHCETSTGLFNPIEAVGAVVRNRGRVYAVDAMSSFGAAPINLVTFGIDYLISSANKCIEGIPGFSFVLARTAALQQSVGFARSLVLDLFSQWQGLEKDGQFRFTPPTHALLAFHQALIELEAEGGVAGRERRYRENHSVLVAGMRRLGFRSLLPPEKQGHIITSFLYPTDPNFQFAEFYGRLSDKGYVIYPGKVSKADCFRIGTIGRIFPADVGNLLRAIEATMGEMGILLAV